MLTQHQGFGQVQQFPAIKMERMSDKDGCLTIVSPGLSAESKIERGFPRDGFNPGNGQVVDPAITATPWFTTHNK
jgi:hypothetical protein